MQKIMFGIFAHPDDEAFGPAGTLFQLRADGYDIHLILLTDGEAGANPDKVADLGTVRLAEWQASADILGVASTHALHYPDGTLEQIDPDELDEKVDEIVAEVVDRYNEQIELSFMTFEPRGLTGHRDHIAASTLTDCVAQEFPTKQIWYFCLDSSQAPLSGTAYYEPRAREDSYVTTRIDVSAQLAGKHRMMDAHVSQRTDAANMKALSHSTECFHIDSF